MSDYRLIALTAETLESMNDTPSHSVRTLAALAVVVGVGLWACDGCNSCLGCGPEREIRELAGAFPPDTPAAVAVTDLQRLLEAPETTLESDAIDDDTRRRWRDDYTEVRGRLEDEFGIDFADPRLWEEAGVDTSGVLFGGLVDATPVVCLPVEQRPEFEQFAETVAAETFDADDPGSETRQIDGHRVHTAGDELAWGYLEDAACLAVSPFRAASQRAVVELMDGAERDDSLDEHRPFERFRDSELSDSLAVAYSEDHHGLWRRLPFVERHPGVAEFLEKTFRGYGARLAIDDDVFDARLFAGLDERNLASVEEAASPREDFSWSRFALGDTSVAVRISADPRVVWEQFRREAPRDLLVNVDNFIGGVEMFTGHRVDVEQELIDNFTGQFGAFVYDIDDPDALTDPRGADLEEDLEVVVAMQFVDEQQLEELIAEVVSAIDADMLPAAEIRPLDDSGGGDTTEIDVIEIQMLDLRFYRAEDVLVAASNSLSPRRVGALIRGEHRDTSLADADSVFGAAVEQDHFNGVYLAGDARGIVEQIVAVNGEIRLFEEALVEFDYTDTGVVAGVQVFPAAGALFGLALPMPLLLERHRLRTIATEADEMVPAIAGEAIAYFRGDQAWSTEGGTEPWHDAARVDETPGTVVDFEDKTFPGGTDVRIRTSEAVPEDGESLQPDPQTFGDGDVDIDVLLHRLGLDLNEPTYFRYTYETGPDTGHNATATIIAEANFDPATPEKHTLTKQLYVDEDATPRVVESATVENQWE